jgi:hypothetical protein
MVGGMSHIDTLDPKPEKPDVQGPVESIATSVSGLAVSEYLPQLAKRLHRAALVRSLSNAAGDHPRAQYLLRTSFAKRATIVHPSIGSWVLQRKERTNPNLPGFVRVAPGGYGAGFLPSRYAPLTLSDPAGGLQNSALPKGVSDEQFADRLGRVERYNAAFRERYAQKSVAAYGDFYRDAVNLMKSSDLEAFDIGRESDKAREAYGEHRFGQACLLARRLVERDVRFIEIAHGYWDTHADNFTTTPQLAGELDRGLCALIDDLAERGLLDDTLIVLASEFGRSPTISGEPAGRNHWPGVFSGLLIGGGVRGGYVHGASDDRGGAPTRDKQTIGDLNATIAYAMGIDHAEEYVAPNGRPFKLADDGEPIRALFA